MQSQHAHRVHQIWQAAFNDPDLSRFYKALVSLGQPVIMKDPKDKHFLAAIGRRLGATSGKIYTFFVSEALLDPNNFTDAEVAFIFMHELLHIMLGQMEEQPFFENPKKFNHAADCIVNDRLVRLGLGDPPDASVAKFTGYDPTAGPSMWYGTHAIGEDCSYRSVAYVYNKLPDSTDGDGDSGTGPGGTMSIEDLAEYINEHGADAFADPNDYDPSRPAREIVISKEGMERLKERLTQEGQKALENAPGKLSSIASNDSSCAGLGAGDPMQVTVERDDFRTWNKLLKKLEIDAMEEHREKVETFKVRNFRHTGLPASCRSRGKWWTQTDNPLPFIAFVVDTSGSISTAWVDKSLARIKSLPADIKGEIATFSQAVIPFDIKSKSNTIDRGGTNWSPIPEYIEELEKQHKRPIDAVLVVTDGEFNETPTLDRSVERKWVFVLIDGFNPNIVGRRSFNGLRGVPWEDFFMEKSS